jgi:AraC family transcriptional regulator
MNVKIVEKEAFNVIGIKRSYSCKDGENLKEIPLLWNEVNANGTTGYLAEKNNGQVKGILGVCVMESTDPTKEMDYWIAAASNVENTNGYESLTIPASKWAIFEVHGPMPESMQKVWKQIYSEWFPTSGYKNAGTPELEVYPDESNPTSVNYYSEIWIPVK